MLLVYKSNHLETLADALSEVLREPLPWAGTPEWVGVQTQGVGVWLGMAVSRRLGIWSNVFSPYPRAMIEKIFSLVLGKACPDTTLFEPGRLTWSVMDLLPELLEAPEFFPLRRYLADDRRGLKRYQLSRRIAETFDRYAVYRPDMVLAWETGSPGETERLLPENRWQPILWQVLIRRLGASHVAAAAKACLDVLRRSNGCPEGLPSRISLFGVSTLPPLYVNLLSALPDCVSVHLFLLSPSREHWAYIRSRREIIREISEAGADAEPLEEILCLEEGNRLLASLGRLGRDFQGVLEGGTDYLEPGEDLFVDPGEGRLLHAVQSDILNLKLRGRGDDSLTVHADDDSLQVHVCHSPMREVQVLYDRLMGIFQDEPEIFPHDVVVMVPDIDTYAPFVEAVFGAGEGGEIPFSVSDRGAADESPVLRAFMEILRLLESRLPVQEVLDLLAMDPVRERFDLTEEDVDAVRAWVLDAGVRWGLDGEHRRSFGQPAHHENTWRFGLERLFLGIAMPDSPPALFRDVLPYPGIEGTPSEVLGKAADFFFALFDLLDEGGGPRPAAQWRRILGRVLSGFVSAEGRNEYQHRMAREALETLGRVSETAEAASPVTLPVVSRWLTEQFGSRPGIHGFLSGGVTFCNLLPMRSIPFKVICLLGMNDADFPRNASPEGFDLTAAHPRAGDRSVRNDDRYLFLEALLSAREKLLIFYLGRAVSDNSALPPSVVVGELLDAVDEGFMGPEESGGNRPGAVRRQIVTEHPLQPFHPAYFDPGDRRRFSFSREHLAGAEALAAPRQKASTFLEEALPAGEEEILQVSISDLIRFFAMPAEYFLRNRLGVDLYEGVEDAEAREPMVLEGLRRFEAGTFLLERTLEGERAENLFPVVRGRGSLPLGSPGRVALADLGESVAALSRAVFDAGGNGESCDPLTLNIEAAGVRVNGEIEAIYSWGRAKARIIATYGKITELRKLSLWIHHVLMNCSEVTSCPGVSILIGRGDKGPETFALGPVPEAGDLVRDFLEIFTTGMRRPLPLFPAASLAFASAFLTDSRDGQAEKALAAARKKFRSGFGSLPGEADHPAVRRVFGERDPLLGIGDFGFASLSLRVFAPMIRAGIPAAEMLGKGGAS